MVREYVGARYVPKFMGTFDVTQQYEALCVVDNGSGTSYISKIPTPAGTPLTDTDHWAIYGASSGAIINLQNQIDDINNNTIPNINSDISDLNDKLDNYINKRYLIIADSYAAYPNVKWDEELINMLDSSNSVSFKASGYGLARPSHKINDYINANYATISDPDTITDILWVGGANDRQTSYSDIETELAIFKANLKTKFPNAEFKMGFVGWSNLFTTRIEMCNCMLWYIKAAYACGVPYLTGSESIMHNASLIDSSDSGHIHPNDDGGYAIARGIYQAITQGNANVMYEETASFTPNGTYVTSPSTAVFTSLLKDGKIVNKLKSVNLTFTAAVSPSRNIQIGTYVDNIYGGEMTLAWHDTTGVNHFTYFNPATGAVNIYLPNGASIGDNIILYFDNTYVCDVSSY